MPDTAFCYHCRIHHPLSEMRRVETKRGRIWRCIKSIEAAKSEIAKRDAYGRMISEANKADAQANHRIMGVSKGN